MDNHESLRREFNNYNPDEDPTGERGRALVDAAMEFNNYDSTEVQRWAKGVPQEVRVDTGRERKPGRKKEDFLRLFREIGESQPFAATEAKISALKALGYRGVRHFGPFEDLDLENPKTRVAVHHFYQGQRRKYFED